MKNALVKGLVNIVATKKNTALTEKQCEKLGTDVKEAFLQWKDSVSFLYACACEYAELYNDRTRSTSDQKLRDAETKLTRQWWHCLGFGEADLLHPRMFVRPLDCETLRTWASGLVIIQTDRTRAFARTGETLFRKYVETLLIVRITSANLISDADRDTYLEYTALEKSVKNKRTQIDGKGDNPGFTRQIADMEKSVADTITMLKAAGVNDSTTEIIVSGKRADIKALRDKVKTLESEIEADTAKLTELKPAYDNALARINACEEIDA